MSFREEFPDFPPETMPVLPKHFEDVSWHNDMMPSFTSEALGLVVWIDYQDAARREFPETPRYSVELQDDDGENVLATDDWDEVLALIAKHTA